LHRVLTDAVKNGTLARNVAAIHAPPNVENEEMKLGFTGWTPIWLNDSHFRLIWKSRRPVSMVSGRLWL
jgi:hypothetical protein